MLKTTTTKQNTGNKIEQKAMTGTVQSMAQEKDIAARPIWPPQRFKTLGAGPTRKI